MWSRSRACICVRACMREDAPIASRLLIFAVLCAQPRLRRSDTPGGREIYLRPCLSFLVGFFQGRTDHEIYQETSMGREVNRNVRRASAVFKKNNC